MALFGLLARLVKPAQLVRVLARVNLDALPLKGAEDVGGAVVLGEVRLFILEVLLLCFQVTLGILLGFSGLSGDLRLGGNVFFFGQQSVFDEPVANGSLFILDKLTKRGGDIGIESID